MHFRWMNSFNSSNKCKQIFSPYLYLRCYPYSDVQHGPWDKGPLRCGDPGQRHGGVSWRIVWIHYCQHHPHWCQRQPSKVFTEWVSESSLIQHRLSLTAAGQWVLPHLHPSACFSVLSCSCCHTSFFCFSGGVPQRSWFHHDPDEMTFYYLRQRRSSSINLRKLTSYLINAQRLYIVNNIYLFLVKSKWYVYLKKEKQNKYCYLCKPCYCVL